MDALNWNEWPYEYLIFLLTKLQSGCCVSHYFWIGLKSNFNLVAKAFVGQKLTKIHSWAYCSCTIAFPKVFNSHLQNMNKIGLAQKKRSRFMYIWPNLEIAEQEKIISYTDIHWSYRLLIRRTRATQCVVYCIVYKHQQRHSKLMTWNEVLSQFIDHLETKESSRHDHVL